MIDLVSGGQIIIIPLLPLGEAAGMPPEPTKVETSFLLKASVYGS